MKKLTFAFVLILCTTSLAFAEELLLSFKDGSTICGSYSLRGNSYCKNMAAGEICWEKADIKTAKQVDDCENSGGFAASNSGATSAAGSSSKGKAYVVGSEVISQEEQAKNREYHRKQVEKGNEWVKRKQAGLE
jgi:hypothetical protein